MSEKTNKLVVWKSISAILGLLLIVAIFTGGFGLNSGDNTNLDGDDDEDTDSGDDDGIDMIELIENDAIKGDEDAPVTIVEWSDYECPFCARFYLETFGQIEDEYIDTGKVKFVYRDFPLSFHQNAQKSAEAAECAGEQNEYYAMHDKLFEEGVDGGVASFKQYAQDIGLDTEQFDECLDSGEMASEVAADMRDGQAVGISGTPGFIINGNLVSGAQPFSVFKQIIDAELTK